MRLSGESIYIVELKRLAAKDFQTAEFHQDTWNRYHRVGFVSAHNPWNAISNLELRLLYNALRSMFVLPSASTLRHICRREYTLTVDAIKKQLPSINKLSLALNGWISTNKLAISSVFTDYIDRNWALREVQLAFDEFDRSIFSHLESSLRITGHGSAYRSTESRTFARSS
jgi:hypothetical protein